LKGEPTTNKTGRGIEKSDAGTQRGNEKAGYRKLGESGEDGAMLKIQSCRLQRLEGWEVTRYQKVEEG